MTIYRKYLSLQIWPAAVDISLISVAKLGSTHALGFLSREEMVRKPACCQEDSFNVHVVKSMNLCMTFVYDYRERKPKRGVGVSVGEIVTL